MLRSDSGLGGQDQGSNFYAAGVKGPKIFLWRGDFVSLSPSATRFTRPEAQFLTVLPSFLYGQHTSKRRPIIALVKAGRLRPAAVLFVFVF